MRLVGPLAMYLTAGEYVIVPDIGRCRVIAQRENRRIDFESPEGMQFCMDVQDLISRIWADFDKEIERDLAERPVLIHDQGNNNGS